MKKVNFLFIGLLLSSQSVLATEIMSCPAVSDIRKAGFIYATEDEKWRSTLRENETSGDIKAFKEANYIVVKDDTAFGLLSKCIYSLYNGTVDMLFTDERQQRNKGLYVSLPSNSSWLKDPEGSLLSSYTCASSNVTDCSFNRFTDEEIGIYLVEIPDDTN